MNERDAVTAPERDLDRQEEGRQEATENEEVPESAKKERMFRDGLADGHPRYEGPEESVADGHAEGEGQGEGEEHYSCMGLPVSDAKGIERRIDHEEDGRKSEQDDKCEGPGPEECGLDWALTSLPDPVSPTQQFTILGPLLVPASLSPEPP